MFLIDETEKERERERERDVLGETGIRGCRWRSLMHGSRSLCNRATCNELELDRKIEIQFFESPAGIPQESIPPLRRARCIKSFLGRFRHRKLALSFFFPSFQHTRISTVRLLRARDGLVPRYCVTAMRGIYETKPSKIPRSNFAALFEPNSVSRLFSRLWING